MLASALWVWVVAACGGETSPVAAAATPKPEAPTIGAGKVGKAPASEVAYGRAVIDALQRDDWEGYTDLLATHADMMGLFAHKRRGAGRERRQRRRLVWRRINRLRDGDAEQGWKDVRREAMRVSLDWAGAEVVDVRRLDAGDERLPDTVQAARLHVDIDHQGRRHTLDLGECVAAERGWVALYPMQWIEPEASAGRGESLLATGAAATPEP